MLAKSPNSLWVRLKFLIHLLFWRADFALPTPPKSNQIIKISIFLGNRVGCLLLTTALQRYLSDTHCLKKEGTLTLFYASTYISRSWTGFFTCTVRFFLLCLAWRLWSHSITSEVFQNFRPRLLLILRRWSSPVILMTLHISCRRERKRTPTRSVSVSSLGELTSSR